MINNGIGAFRDRFVIIVMAFVTRARTYTAFLPFNLLTLG